MKSIKITGRDLKELFSSRFKRISLIVVVLMPLLYSFLYLYAFWDPYSKLDKMPIAVVQMDKGSVKDGERVNYGNDVISKLKDNRKVNWEFVSYDEANKGLTGKKYYSMIVIPENFSQKITDSADGKVDKASIKYIPNEKENFLAAQVSSRIVLELKDEIARSISQESSKVVIENLYDVKSGIKEAYDGSSKLYDGSLKLRDGSTLLSDNMKTASNGSRLLADGLSTAANGQSKLVNGLDSLISGLKQFGGALSQSDDRIPQLVKGASDLENGVGRLVVGLKRFNSELSSSDTSQLNQLVNGAGDLTKGLTDARKGAEELSSKLSSNLTLAAGGISQAADGINIANNNLSSVKEAVLASNLSNEDKAKILQASGIIGNVVKSDLKKNIAEPLKNSTSAAQPLVKGLSELESGASRVSKGTMMLAKGLELKQAQATDGMNQIIFGAEEAHKGAKLVAGGTEALVAGLSEKQSQASSGVNQLMNGALLTRNGADKIASGLDTAASKSGELSSGLSKLYDGSKSLNDGLNKLNDGSMELKEGLGNGYNEIDSKLKFSSEDMSKFMSEPVKLNEEPINHVPDYGTGFAPYFIPLSLWVGALIIFFIVTNEVDERFKGKTVSIVVGKFMTLALVGAMQAAASSFILRTVLHLDVKNVAMFYLFNILLSWAFIAVIQCMIYIFGEAGRFLSLVLLMLQLTSCGGTFPMELVPNFFRTIKPYLPMTYAVSALREIISGTDYNVLSKDIIILFGFMSIFIILSVILKNIINRVSRKIDNKNELKVA